MAEKPISPPDADDDPIKRFRSPPYPFVALGKAVERVKELHPKSLHHAVGITVLADAWGYSPSSSGLVQTAAALIQFGLLIDEGAGPKRKFQLSSDAVRIIQDADPNSLKRKEALGRAALFPKIHKELWEKFGASQVSDMVLKNYLMLDRSEAGMAPFSLLAAESLIQEYQETIAYAGLSESANMSPTEEVHNTYGQPSQPSHPPGFQKEPDGGFTFRANVLPSGPHKGEASKLMSNERELVTGLLSKDASFRLIVTGKVGAKEIDRLIQKLNLDKEILASKDEDDPNLDADFK